MKPIITVRCDSCTKTENLTLVGRREADRGYVYSIDHDQLEKAGWYLASKNRIWEADETYTLCKDCYLELIRELSKVYERFEDRIERNLDPLEIDKIRDAWGYK